MQLCGTQRIIRGKKMEAQYIISLVQSIVFLTPLGILIWKFATMHSKVLQNEQCVQKAHERLDNYTSKTEKKIEEMASQIHNIMAIQIRIEEKLNYILQVKETK